MLKMAKTYFTQSLLKDLMLKANVCTFASNADMLKHLKRCMQFMSKSKKVLATLNTIVRLEEQTTNKVEELSVVVTAF